MNKKRKIKYGRIIVLLIIVIIIISSVFVIIKKDKKIKMIDLVNSNIKIAEDFVLKHKLELIKNYKYSNEFEKDIIINQSIKKDLILKKGDKITVEVSLGEIDKTVYKENNVNELGLVPVMMYHGIHNVKSDDTAYTGGNIDQSGYQRTKEAFINDLEFFYKEGYRMIRLNDYVNGEIDVELGKSPIVLTFDDGLKNNIIVTGLDSNGDIIIDENSAVGVLESFKKKYPDYNVTATFFINGGLFQQPDYNEKIIKWLADNGYDVGNHSYGHASLDSISKDELQKEMGTIYQKLESIIPNKYVNIVALPFGKPYDKSHENYQYILNGMYNNIAYNTIAALRVGWESDYSPFSKSFDKTFIKRIRAYDNKGIDFDIEMNFKRLETSRYISDGDKNTIVIKNSDADYLKEGLTKEIIKYE